MSPTGVVQAIAPGQATITASVDGKEGYATVTISQVPVATVEVTPQSAALFVGGALQFSAVARGEDGSALPGRLVAWSSSGPAATVDANGLVTAVAPGQVTITATVEGKSGEATVTVEPVPVITVDVTPASASIVAGDSVQFQATPRAADGTPLSGRTITWSSSNPALAEISATGMAKGKAPGTVTITATVDGRSGTADLTVTPKPVASVEVVSTRDTLSVGESLQLVAIVRADDGTILEDREIEWQTSNSSVATVGESTGLVQAIAAGEVTITAETDGHSGSVVITVENPVAVQVIPSSVCLVPILNPTQQLQAKVFGKNGQELPVPVTWSSSNDSVVTVDNTGVVQAVSIVGTATITATAPGGTSGSATVGVTICP